MKYFRRLVLYLTMFVVTGVTTFASLTPVASASLSPLPLDDRILANQDAGWVDRSAIPCSGGDSTDLPNGTPDENGQAIFNFFVGKGLKPFQAAGIIGNMVVESGLLPQRLQGTPASKITPAVQAANSRSGWGLVQFTPAGKFIKNYAPPYDASVRPPYQEANNLGTQLDFIWAQLQGQTHIPEATAGKDIAGTATIEQAVLAFQGDKQVGGKYFGYERPANESASVRLRTNYAKAALVKYGSAVQTPANPDDTLPDNISTDTNIGCAASGVEMDVMSYNIWSDTVGPNWSHRLDLAVKTVVAYAPDIIGFQEVHSDGQRDGLKSKLGDYDQWPGPSGGSDGAKRPIYWLKSEFQKIDGGHITIHTINGSVPQPWVKLKNSGGDIFYVINMHPSPGHATSSEDDRRDAANKALDFVKGHGDGSTIITGDWNSSCEKGPQTPCSIFESHGFKDSEGIAEVKVNDEYATSHGGVGSFSKNGSHHIDHVFLSDDIAIVKKWENVINEDTKYASDHTPVVASLSTGADGGGVGGWAWPLGKAHWDAHKASYLQAHTGRNRSGPTGTAWGADNMGTSGKGPGIADDIGLGTSTPKVYAMYGGVVTSTSLCGEGDGIAIKSKVGGKTLGIAYMHGTNKQFKVGQTVQAGKYIMDGGRLGCSASGNHLHLGMAYDGKYLCPQDVFLAMDAGKPVDLAALTAKAKAPCGGRAL